MPPEGIKLLKNTEMLSYDEILKSVKLFADLGIKKIRLTGGEPLVRKDIIDLIKGLKNISGIEDISITTNGILLEKYLKDLKRFGIERINISIDTLDPYKYSTITRGGALRNVLSSLRKAFNMNFKEIKINVVITDLLDIKDIEGFIELSKKFPVFIRFIEMMKLPDINQYYKKNIEDNSVECSSHFAMMGIYENNKSKKISVKDIIYTLNDYGSYKKYNKKIGFGPAIYYKDKNSKGFIGFIIDNKDFCYSCNRIRLMSKGTIKLCLFSDLEFDLKGRLRQNKSEYFIKMELIDFIRKKPENRLVSCMIKKINNINPDNNRNHVDWKLTDYMNKIGG
jgi:cyclic pyranopterin phosphate synthase